MVILNRSALSAIALVTFAFLFAGCMNYGEKKEFNKGDLYYTEGVDVADVDKLGEYLVEADFFDGVEKSVQLQKNGDRYVFRVVMQDEFLGKEETTRNFRLIGMLLSSQVFNDAPVDVELTDAYFETQEEIPFVGGDDQGIPDDMTSETDGDTTVTSTSDQSADSM